MLSDSRSRKESYPRMHQKKMMKTKQLTFGLLTLCIANSGAAIVWNLGDSTPGRAAPRRKPPASTEPLTR